MRPIIIYGSEGWTLKTTDVEDLGRFERKIWRRFYGAIKTGENEYRKRWNSEIYQMYDDIDIISFIRQISGQIEVTRSCL